jgi:hypothetical protein
MFKNQMTILVGNAGRDAEMRVMPNGGSVTTVSLGVNCGYYDKEDKWIDRTMWVRGQVWGKGAEKVADTIRTGHTVELRGEWTFDPATGGPKVFQRKGDDAGYGASFEMRVDQWKDFSVRGAAAPVEGEGEVSDDNQSFPL